jgi:hypothetical protein
MDRSTFINLTITELKSQGITSKAKPGTKSLVLPKVDPFDVAHSLSFDLPQITDEGATNLAFQLQKQYELTSEDSSIQNNTTIQLTKRILQGILEVISSSSSLLNTTTTTTTATSTIGLANLYLTCFFRLHLWILKNHVPSWIDQEASDFITTQYEANYVSCLANLSDEEWSKLRVTELCLISIQQTKSLRYFTILVDRSTHKTFLGSSLLTALDNLQLENQLLKTKLLAKTLASIGYHKRAKSPKKNSEEQRQLTTIVHDFLISIDTTTLQLLKQDQFSDCCTLLEVVLVDSLTLSTPNQQQRQQQKLPLPLQSLVKDFLTTDEMILQKYQDKRFVETFVTIATLYDGLEFNVEIIKNKLVEETTTPLSPTEILFFMISTSYYSVNQDVTNMTLSLVQKVVSTTPTATTTTTTTTTKQQDNKTDVDDSTTTSPCEELLKLLLKRELLGYPIARFLSHQWKEPGAAQELESIIRSQLKDKASRDKNLTIQLKRLRAILLQEKDAVD